MFEISGCQVEWVKDPFGILAGKRYELKLELDVAEEDELYSEKGVYIRVIYSVEEARQGIVKYEFYEKGTDRYLDFEMEEDELAAVEDYCKGRLASEESGTTANS